MGWKDAPTVSGWQSAPVVQKAKPQPKPKSFWQGVAEGARPFAANAGRMIAAANPITAAADAAANLAGVKAGPTNIVNAYDTAARQSLESSPYQGSGLGRFVGGIVGAAPSMLIPGGPITQGAKGLSRLLPGTAVRQGMAAGALGTDAPGGQISPGDLALNVAVGGVAGKAGQMLAKPIARAGSAVTQGVRRAIGRPAAAPSQPAHPLAALEAQAPGTIQRASDLEQLGVRQPTTAMLTRDPEAWAFERNVSGIEGAGTPLAGQIRDVERQLVSFGEDLASGARGQYQTGTGSQQFLTDKMDEMQKVVGGLYRQTRAASQHLDARAELDEAQAAYRAARGTMVGGNIDDAAARVTRAREMLREAEVAVAANPGGIVPKGRIGIDENSTLGKAMQDPDFVDNEAYTQVRNSIAKRLDRLAKESGKPSITIRQAEGLRQFIGKLGGQDPTTRLVRRNLIDALDDDVVEAVGDDAFKTARNTARARFEELEGLVGRITEGGIHPERISTRIMQSGISIDDLKALRKSYTTGTQSQVARGRQELGMLQKQVLDDMLTGPNGAIDTLDSTINGTRLWKTFSSNKDKLRVLLDPRDFSAVGRLARVSRDVTKQPLSAAVNNSKTGAFIANLFKEPAAAQPSLARGAGKVAMRGGLHAGAGAAFGPVGNLAVAAGEATAGQMAQTRAAQAAADALARRVQLARNPQEAAAAIQALQEAAQSSAAARVVLDRIGGALGITGVAALQTARQ